MHNVNNVILDTFFRSYLLESWLVWISWLEHHDSVDQRVAGSIPGQGTYPVCGFDLQLGCIQEANWSTFLSHIDIFFLSYSLTFTPLLSLKAMKKKSLGEDLKNNNKICLLEIYTELFIDALICWDLFQNNAAGWLQRVGG